MPALSHNAKTLALASPKLNALSGEEYMNLVETVQHLATEAKVEEGQPGFDLCDLAFAGLLWSKGLLQEMPVEVLGS